MKNKILKAITYVDVIILILAVTLLDSVSNIPLITAFICTGWLLIMVICNQEYLNKKYG